MHGDYSPEQLGRYKYEDEKGKFKAEQLTAPHFSETRTIEWRGTHPGANRQWRFSTEELDRLFSEGKILLQKDGRPRKDGLKEYLDDQDGAALQDIWTDISMSPTTKERLGYPTQKPLALLERIVEASSNPGDIVLDPFCGCGTAIHAAQKLDRQWIGIDVTHLAIGLIESRLKTAFPSLKFAVEGTPKDFEAAVDLAFRDKFQFQWWAVTLVNAVPYGNKKKGADSGIDGYYYCKPDGKQTEAGIVSVKGGDNPGVKDIRDLVGVVQREKAPVGVLITLREPTGPMKAEAAKAGSFDCAWGKYQKIQIVTVKELLEGKNLKLPPQEAGGGLKQAPKEDTSAKNQKVLL